MSVKLLPWIIATTACAMMAFGAVQNETSVELPPGEGNQILERACTTCHGLTQIAKDEGLAKDGWRKIVQDMVALGADIKTDQVNVLAEYLATNFGEGRKILDTACTTCHTLEEVKKFRGFFKKEDWQDVVTTMVKYGAILKEAQVPVLVEYLSTAYR